MTWWALLFGLSSLARYHPAPWITLLRRDGNKDAVPLETAMDEALEAVPHLALEALLGETTSDRLPSRRRLGAPAP